MTNIKMFRERKNLSQQKLATAVGVCQQAVARWENGSAMPRADQLPKLARLLGCTIDELFVHTQMESMGKQTQIHKEAAPKRGGEEEVVNDCGHRI